MSVWRDRGGLGALVLPVALGCNALDDETCEIATADISMVAQVIDSGLDIRATVDFERGDRRGAGAPLRLCDTDRLTINGMSPEAIDKASRVEYAVGFAADAERRFDFVLARQDQEERVTFSVDLPAAFEITAPAPAAELSFDQAQVVEWAPPATADDTILVGLREELGGGQCIAPPIDPADPDPETESPYEERDGVPVPDTGQWTVLAGELVTAVTEPCAVTYALTRLNLGDYPANFERGGRIEARVERYLDVIANP